MCAQSGRCLICIFRILGSGNSMVIVGCDVWLYLNLKATEMGKGNLLRIIRCATLSHMSEILNEYSLYMNFLLNMATLILSCFVFGAILKGY